MSSDSSPTVPDWRQLFGKEAWHDAAQRVSGDYYQRLRAALDSLVESGVLTIEYRTIQWEGYRDDVYGHPIAGTVQQKKRREQRLVSRWVPAEQATP